MSREVKKWIYLLQDFLVDVDGGMIKKLEAMHSEEQRNDYCLQLVYKKLDEYR